MLRIWLIGQMRLELDGTQLPLPESGRARSLLAWLALRPGSHPRATVAARFWPDTLDSSARTNLRSTLLTLRQELGPEAAAHIVATRDSVGMPRGGDTWVDAVEFLSLIDAGDFEEAVALADGELLEGIDDEWAHSARGDHRDQLTVALGRLAAAAEAAGDLPAAVSWTRRLVARDPVSEEAHRELIRRLAAAGDRPAAVAAFAQLRSRLADQLQMAPSMPTRELVDAVRRDPGEPRATAARPPLPPVLAMPSGPPFVGRADALAQLRSAWSSARDGAPRLCLIAGEPGIGKSRLAAELACAAHGDGATVLYGRAYPEALTAYQPFAEALRVSRLADLIERADNDRHALFDAVAAELDRPAPGTLLVLDDLHWADQPTLLLLQHVLRSDQPGRLLVVGTYRHAEADPGGPLAEALAELRRDRPFERVLLGGLGHAELADLIAGVTGSAAQDRFVAAVHDETEGNPFFAAEVLRHLTESGGLDERMASGSLGPMGVPEGVKDVIGRRLARLGEHPNHLLAIAAVVGRRFGLDVLERLAGLDEEELIAAVEDALGADLIADEPGAPGRFTFTHALVRETAYDALSQARRMRLHRRVGRAIEELHRDDRAPYLGELAHHFVAAAEPGHVDEAIGYATAAGERAMQQLAYEDAAAHYRAALDVLALADGPDDDRRCDLLLALGAAEARAGEGADAREHFERAADLGERLGSPERVAEAALGYGADVLGGLWWLSVGIVDERMVDLLSRALRMLPPDGALRARVLAQRAMQCYWTREREHGKAMSAEAVEMARADGDARTILYTLATRHAVLWGPDAVDEQLDVAGVIVRLAEASGDRERGLVGHGWRLNDLLVLGDRAAVDDEVDTCVQWAAELRQRAHSWYATHCRAMLALLEGRFDAVEDLIRTALELNPQVHDQSASQSWVIQMFALRGEQGRLAELDEPISAAPDLYPSVPTWRCALAYALAEQDREADCRAQFERCAEDDFGALPRDGNWLTGMAYAARTCGYLGDAERAAVLHGQLLPYRRLNVVTGLGISCLGSVEHYLGILAGTAGMYEDSEAHFAAARAMHEQLRSPPLVAHTDHQHARALLARGGQDDLTRAGDLLASALATAEALGMARLYEACTSATPASGVATRKLKLSSR
ncbi:MAG: eukaryotic-like serine/threonine-protein kinase [Thermoleophilales bacterium]|nr:eukaryotic-like serine/threonine-protein kinase [Thermoleophilales bacterium]